MIKKCGVCDKEFETANSRRKYCSDECRISSNSLTSLNYYYANHERMKRTNRENYYKKKNKRPSYICKICNGAINENTGTKHYHEKCVINEAIQAIKEDVKKISKDSRVIRAWNTFNYTVSELKEIMQEEV